MASSGPKERPFCKGSINAEMYMQVLERRMLQSRGHLFPGKAFYISARQRLSPIENDKIRQRRLRTVEPQLLPSVSRCLQPPVKRRGDVVNVSQLF